jgi:hypothetical protein
LNLLLDISTNSVNHLLNKNETKNSLAQELQKDSFYLLSQQFLCHLFLQVNGPDIKQLNRFGTQIWDTDLVHRFGTITSTVGTGIDQTGFKSSKDLNICKTLSQVRTSKPSDHFPNIPENKPDQEIDQETNQIKK